MEVFKVEPLRQSLTNGLLVAVAASAQWQITEGLALAVGMKH